MVNITTDIIYSLHQELMTEIQENKIGNAYWKSTGLRALKVSRIVHIVFERHLLI